MPHKAGRLPRLLPSAAVLMAGLSLSSAVQAQTVLRDILGQIGPANRTVVRQGQSTEAEGGPTAQSAVGETPAAATAKPEPFGASLFAGGAPATSDAVNPNYVIQPGDRIGISVLGGPPAPTTPASPDGTAPASQSTSIVDPEGNIFLPEVGPVHVAGVRAGALQPTIQQATSKTFTANVQFYAVLLTTHRTGVYVAGFVAHPGRYAGSASDTVLDYLVRAGGVDPSRGSYRNITVARGSKTLARIDLYDFLLTGKMPSVALQEGDTVFVARQNAMVAVDGAVRNNYLFEITGQAAGREIAELARPLPSATHAIVKGSRDGQPFSRYATLAELTALQIQDQDQVTFVTDAAERTIRVRIEGSRIGPSVLVAGTDARLSNLLNYVAVDPALADTGSVYVLRKSVAEQQTRVMNEALDRLERSLFLAASPTTGVAQIRGSEAQLVASYIQRVRRVQPEGRLVVSDDQGRLADFRLEDDDVVVIPQRSQMVLVSGEVLAAQAVLFRPGLSRQDYINLAGGYSERGRKGHFLIRRANGAILMDQDVAVRPGDELIVLPYIDPKYFQIGSDLLSLVYQAAVAANVIKTF